MNCELPHHFYSALWTKLSRKMIAGLFGRHGWSVRKCGWDEYEVINEVAELVIEGDEPILVHGAVSSVENVAPVIDDILSAAGIEFTFEGYDENDQIVMSRSERDRK